MVVTPSRAMAQMIHDTCARLDGQKFRVLYRGFERKALSDPPAADLSERLTAVSGVKLLYRTHPACHKGFEVLFDIIARLKREGVEATLVTTISRDGWPSGVEAYEPRIAELEIADRGFHVRVSADGTSPALGCSVSWSRDICPPAFLRQMRSDDPPRRTAMPLRPERDGVTKLQERSRRGEFA